MGTVGGGEPESETHSVMSHSLQPRGLCGPWNSPDQNSGVGSCSLLQGIFPTQRLNTGLPHCRWILYQLSHQGSPRILERVTYLFSSRSSWPRNQTGVSCIAGRFFTSWVTRETSYRADHVKNQVQDLNYKGSKIEKETTYSHNRCPMLESGPWHKKGKSVRTGMGTFVWMTLKILNP